MELESQERNVKTEDNEDVVSNICEVTFEVDGADTRPTTQSTGETKLKPSKTKLKIKKENNEAEATTQVKPKKVTGHLRRNIRDILKEDALEAETRAAQHSEIERVQRLHQQQIPECSYVPEEIPVEFLESKQSTQQTSNSYIAKVITISVLI